MRTSLSAGSTRPESAVESLANENKYLSFCLGEEEYGVEILRVREIIGLIEITPLPQTPDYLKGVINLRGKIIPVIELRAKLGMSQAPFTKETCIIVVEVTDDSDREPFRMGVIVDRVREVLDINSGEIKPSPRFGGGLRTDFIHGMGKVAAASGEKVVILLDIDRILTAEDVVTLPGENGTVNSAGDGSAPGHSKVDSYDSPPAQQLFAA